MIRRVAAIAAVAAAVFALSTPAGAAPEPIGDCTTSSGAILAVDFSHWGGPVIRACGTANGTTDTGYQLLNEGGWQTQGDNHDGPAFICRIGYSGYDGGEMFPTPAQDPCILTPPATAYWSYWHANPGQNTWSYSQLGAMLYKPLPGSVDAWVFGATNIAGTEGGPSFTPDQVRAHNTTPIGGVKPVGPTGPVDTRGMNTGPPPETTPATTTPTATAPAPVTSCTPTTGTRLIIDYSHWGLPLAAGCDTDIGPATSTSDLFAGAGFVVRTSGTNVCAVAASSVSADGPFRSTCPTDAAPTDHWTYWTSTPGQTTWTAAAGLPTTPPTNGEIAVLTFGGTNISQSSRQPTFTPEQTRGITTPTVAPAQLTALPGGAKAPRIVNAQPRADAPHSTGSLLPVLLGVGLVVLLALGAGGFIWRRRRPAE